MCGFVLEFYHLASFKNQSHILFKKYQINSVVARMQTGRNAVLLATSD